MEKRISHELTVIYITSDGKKFIEEIDAKRHNILLGIIEKERGGTD
jgi:hypothetical protein